MLIALFQMNRHDCVCPPLTCTTAPPNCLELDPIQSWASWLLLPLGGVEQLGDEQGLKADQDYNLLTIYTLTKA